MKTETLEAEKSQISPREKILRLRREIDDYMHEAGIRVNGFIGLGRSKNRPTALVYLEYDPRHSPAMSPYMEGKFDEEKFDKQMERINKNKKIASEIMRGYGFERNGEGHFPKGMLSLALPFVYNPECN